jgi:hypothetical protein
MLAERREKEPPSTSKRASEGNLSAQVSESPRSLHPISPAGRARFEADSKLCCGSVDDGVALI